MNDAFKGKLAFDELAKLPMVWGALPWDKGEMNGRRAWTDADISFTRSHMERYGLVSTRVIDDAIAKLFGSVRRDPLREYLEGLPEWDGVERLDDVLVRYLGAENTEITRAFTRKWFVGAVRRALNPGCKMDYMLVFTGSQGIGKSTFAEVISKGWYSNTLTRMDNSKEAMEAVHGGAWIIEVAELAASRKSDRDALKNFLSTQVDRFRPAYGRNTVQYKRRVAFIGSTNEAEYLRDSTGARRFWPIPCAGVPEKRRGMPGLREEVDLLWAEALYRLRQGETSYLESDELERDAKELQENYSVSDEWEGLVEDYLNTPVPEDWYEWDAEERIDYFHGGIRNKQNTPGTMLRDVVSVIEIRCECFRQSASANGRGVDSRRIIGIMAGMYGWERDRRRPRVPGYGQQRAVYRRKTETL